MPLDPHHVLESLINLITEILLEKFYYILSMRGHTYSITSLHMVKQNPHRILQQAKSFSSSGDQAALGLNYTPVPRSLNVHPCNRTGPMWAPQVDCFEEQHTSPKTLASPKDTRLPE